MPNNSHQPEWRFREVVPGDMYVDPTHDEFFTTQDVGGLNHALVRETIQNTMDARDPAHEGPLLVRFSFREVNPSARINAFLTGLGPHLKAVQDGIVKLPGAEDPITFLTIEDLGTFGLEGDPAELRVDPEDGQRHNFFYFWRNIGRSDKRDSDRGRWGLGKAVFPVVSSARTFFGLTIRSSDRHQYLMGHSLLKIHDLPDGSMYQPYGHFGCFTHPEYPTFPLPIEEENTIKEFSDLFSVYRTDEPGLSIVVPFLRSEISLINVAQAVLEQFFYPILSGELDVLIENREKTYEVSSESIEEIARELSQVCPELDLEPYIRLLDFTRWILNDPDDAEPIIVNEQNWEQAPKWRSELLDEELLLELKNGIYAGERLVFDVPTKVQKEGGELEIAHFKVYLEMDDELRRAEDHFIRGGLRISGISSLRQRGVRGMVVVDEEPLISMLGDAENPAHTEWQKDARGFKDKYVHSFSCLYFVINSVKNLANFILAAGTDTDPELLEDFFSLPAAPSEEEPPDDAGAQGQGGEVTTPPVVKVERKPKPVRIERIAGGFSIHPTGKGESIKSMTIKVAYDAIRGNPFSQHSSADFDLRDADIKIEYPGVDNPQIEENTINCPTVSSDFHISVSGFDEKRDVVVDVNWIGFDS
jgi:hypothetical protein